MADRILDFLDNSIFGRFLYAVLGWSAIVAGAVAALAFVGIFIKPILIILLVALVIWWIL